MIILHTDDACCDCSYVDAYDFDQFIRPIIVDRLIRGELSACNWSKLGSDDRE